MIEESSVYTDATAAPETPRVNDLPVFRSFCSSNTLMLRDGQTSQFTAATDRVSGEVVKVDVTLRKTSHDCTSAVGLFCGVVGKMSLFRGHILKQTLDPDTSSRVFVPGRPWNVSCHLRVVRRGEISSRRLTVLGCRMCG